MTTTRAQHGIDGIELDICASQGTWFDAHEQAQLRAEVNAVYPAHSGLGTLSAFFPVSTRDVGIFRLLP